MVPEILQLTKCRSQLASHIRIMSFPFSIMSQSCPFPAQAQLSSLFFLDHFLLEEYNGIASTGILSQSTATAAKPSIHSLAPYDKFEIPTNLDSANPYMPTKNYTNRIFAKVLFPLYKYPSSPFRQEYNEQAKRHSRTLIIGSSIAQLQ